MFELDQQVVCIREDWRKRTTANEIYPKKNQVLTIRDIITVFPEDYTYEIGLQFYEIVNQPRMYAGLSDPVEISFPGSAFRPVKKTSIEQFTQITKKAPTTKLEDA